MKKIFVIISLLFATSVSYSQVISFELDMIQVFKCPANLSPNEAVVLNKFEYFDLKKFKRQVWTINLKKKIFKVNGKIINIVRSESDLKEKWVYIEFLSPKGELYKLAIATEKGTDKDIIIVLTLDKDLIKQKGYFGYPIGLKGII
jgi:hypothetical protein